MEATLYFFLSENSPKNVEAHCGLLSRAEVLWAHDLWSCLPMASVSCNVDLPSFLTPAPLLPGWAPQFLLCWKFSLGKWKQSLWCSKISARSDRCIPNTSLGLGYPPRSPWVLECVVCCHKSPSESSFFFSMFLSSFKGPWLILDFPDLTRFVFLWVSWQYTSLCFLPRLSFSWSPFHSVMQEESFLWSFISTAINIRHRHLGTSLVWVWQAGLNFLGLVLCIWAVGCIHGRSVSETKKGGPLPELRLVSWLLGFSFCPGVFMDCVKRVKKKKILEAMIY